MIWFVIAFSSVEWSLPSPGACTRMHTRTGAHAAGTNACACVCERCECVRPWVRVCTVQLCTDGWDFMLFIQSNCNQIANAWAEPQALGNSSTNSSVEQGLSCAGRNTFWLRKSTWTIFSNSQDIEFWQHAATSQRFPDSWSLPKGILHLSQGTEDRRCLFNLTITTSSENNLEKK